MEWWEFASWGLFGGFITDGLEFWRLVRNNEGKWPKDFWSGAFIVAEGVRLLAGAGLALAFGESGQVSGPVGALAIGVAAPLIVEKFAQQLPTFPTPTSGDEG